VAVALVGFSLGTRGFGGAFNDFYDYWGAARLLASGGNPYDTAALAAVVQAQGVQFQVGTGYSYPLIFAVLMLPLAALPPTTAAVVFTVLSLAALTLAVAILLAPLSGLPSWELALIAGLLGGSTAVRGSLYFGQANLVVLALLALAHRGVARPLTLAVASAVKLYPVAGFIALAARGGREAGVMLAGVAGTAALVILPTLLLAPAGADRLASFLGPDPFWSNQSINGWVSRLALASDVTVPPLPGLPVTATMLALVAVLGLAVATVVLARRGRPWDGCLSLVLAWAVVAAPKNSLWNYTPLLLAFVYCWPRVRRRPAVLAVLLVGYALINVQANIDSLRDSFYGGQPGLTWLSSLALYGAVLVGGLTAYLVVSERPPAQPAAEPG
jgi:hypothetical protein